MVFDFACVQIIFLLTDLEMLNMENDNNSPNNIKKWFSFSNISTIIMVIFVLAMLLKPNFKAFIIQNLMKIGLFQPNPPSKSEIGNKTEESFSKVPNNVIFKDVNGRIFGLEDLKGKVVFLNSWATWCPPCVAEMPSIDNLRKSYVNEDSIVFLMIDADGDFKKARAFMSKSGYDLPVYVAASQIPESVFGDSLPTTVILDKKGNIVFRHEGAADYASQKMKDFIDALIEE